MARKISPVRQSKANSNKSEGENGFVEIGRKLGITIPAGLILLAGINTDVSAHTKDASVNPKAAAEIQKTGSNEVADQLLGYAKKGIIVASAADCSGLHGDTHVNTDDPNITVNGKHGNVHTDQHGDSCR